MIRGTNVATLQPSETTLRFIHLARTGRYIITELRHDLLFWCRRKRLGKYQSQDGHKYLHRYE